MTYLEAAAMADQASNEARMANIHSTDTERAITHLGKSLEALSQAVAELARTSHRA
jgi:hypothetical protein